MIKTNCNLLVIFGATGDLARRKLFPALNDIISSKKLPKNTYLLGCGRKKVNNNIFNDLDKSIKNKLQLSFIIVLYVLKRKLNHIT
jgi:glucose-6-phosphate 1-dehydrogenase